ncbi:MAG TPA: hypothetical protein VGV89_10395 [Thermoplasmata archaeon]|nr:hypothetical protein [Thermoplasmata archaeon]
MVTRVWLGADTSTQEDVLEPIGHLAVFGQTRKAGKTTSLRTIVERAASSGGGAAVLVFRTGRGEIPFDYYPSTPFFRPRLDWHGVEAMLWTFLAEKPKVYRPILMRATRGARTLEEVRDAIVAAGKKSKNGWVVDRTYELERYFEEILPWLAEHPLASNVALADRLSVVDLEGWPETTQQLVIASTLDALMDGGKRGRPLIVVLPEARTFVPSDRATPVKLAADRLTRMGAKLNLFLWIDSQSLTGVDQLVLRNFALLLQGVQTSDIEIRRVSKALEVPPKIIRSLAVGDFVLHTQDGARTIHVPLVESRVEVENVDAKKEQEYLNQIAARDEEIRRLEERVARLTEQFGEEHRRAEANAHVAAANAVTRIKGAPPLAGMVTDKDAPGNAGHRADLSDREQSERTDLHVTRETPNLTVHVREVRVDADGESNHGRAALLVAIGYFDERKSVNETMREFKERGWGIFSGGSGWNNMDRLLKKLAEQGFLRNVDKGYVLVPEAKARIRTVAEPAVA